MQRRRFVKGLAAGGLAAGLSACSSDCETTTTRADARTFNWKMVTTWPPNFPGLGAAATNLAKRIEAASGGRIRIRVYAAGELVPAFETFDAVSRGTADIGHSGAYYWKAKIEAAQFVATIPFGLNAAEMNGWMYYGDGLSLWQALYEPFGVVPFPAGNTGAQMGGWYNREINSAEDLKDLKMRIPGLGGEVLKRAGGIPVTLPGGEIFTALQLGNIDATEWVGPYNDVTFGFPRVAKYYYYPGWHEPGPMLEAIINGDRWAELPDDLQAIVRDCCQAINCDMLAEYSFRNAQIFNDLVKNPEVDVRAFPTEVLQVMREHTDAVVAEITARNADAKRVYASLDAYRRLSTPFQLATEVAVLNARNETSS
ncbi:MAG: TRAP transporter substrate-binding protein [Pseudomonadota bacterium]